MAIARFSVSAEQAPEWVMRAIFLFAVLPYVELFALTCRPPAGRKITRP